MEMTQLVLLIVHAQFDHHRPIHACGIVIPISISMMMQVHSSVKTAQLVHYILIIGMVVLKEIIVLYVMMMNVKDATTSIQMQPAIFVFQEQMESTGAIQAIATVKLVNCIIQQLTHVSYVM